MLGTEPKEISSMATRRQHDKMDHAQDRAVEDSFPASDPPANSGITGPEPADKPSHKRTVEARPTGTPTSDRHAAETAHQWEHKE
jgi:hypothetical protein